MKIFRDAIFLMLGLIGLLALATTVSANVFVLDKTIEGTVTIVGENQITIVPIQPGSEQNGTVRLNVNDQTAYNKINSLGQLVQGDKVRASYYREEAGQNVATSVTRVAEHTDQLSFNKFVGSLNPVQ